MAEDASRQLEEIEANIISSSSIFDRSLAYGSLLQFQEISANDPFAIQALSERSQRLLPLICADASYDDEEMSVSSSHSSPSKSLYDRSNEEPPMLPYLFFFLSSIKEQIGA